MGRWFDTLGTPAGPVGSTMSQGFFNIPARPSGAPTGSELILRLKQDNQPGEERDRTIADEIISGNVPDFMRITHAVEVEPNVRIYSVPDYLCVGTDDDYVHVPINPMEFQRICDAFGALAPTRKIVDRVWQAAKARLAPRPMTPQAGFPYGADMMTVDRFATHSRWCRDGLAALIASGAAKLGDLVAGHKKDVVICKSVQQPADQKVAIYGWHQLNGKPIQGPGIQDRIHEITYRDYSHGLRLISDVMDLHGKRESLSAVLADPLVARAVSDEKPPQILSPRYVLPRS